MPVSYFPLAFAAALIGAPCFAWCFGSRKHAARITGVCCAVIATVFGGVFLPGLMHAVGAKAGAPRAQYEYARWLENHCTALQTWLPIPCNSDVEAGYLWLERAAENNYTPAIYILGVRLKYGIHVPRPKDWSGPGGNTFPQPERGQVLMDEALSRGFRPRVTEAAAYYQSFRRL